MRNIVDVLNEMIKVVPSDMGDRFKHIIEKCDYTPPESVGIRWKDAQIILSGSLPKDPKDLNEWQKKALKIWTGKDW